MNMNRRIDDHRGAMFLCVMCYMLYGFVMGVVTTLVVLKVAGVIW